MENYLCLHLTKVPWGAALHIGSILGSHPGSNLVNPKKFLRNFLILLGFIDRPAKSKVD